MPPLSLRRAVRDLIARVPALAADPRPVTMHEVSQRLKTTDVNAARVAEANPDDVARVRAELLADGYWPAPRNDLAPALVSGASIGGRAHQAVLTRSGIPVVLVDKAPAKPLAAPLAVKLGAFDSLELVKPGLGTASEQASSPLTQLDRLMVVDGRLRGEAGFLPPLAVTPEARFAPETGEQLLDGTIPRLITPKRLHEVFDAALPPPMLRIDGELAPTIDPDTNEVVWAVKTATGVVDPFDGQAPSIVVVSEGTKSTTRGALDNEVAPMSPEKWFISGFSPLNHPQNLAGNGALRTVDEVRPCIDPRTGASTYEPLLYGAASDGITGTSILVQADVDAYGRAVVPQDQSQINARFSAGMSLATGHAPQTILQAGVTGPYGTPGSLPTLFQLRCDVARYGAEVIESRTGAATVVGYVGDTLTAPSFQVAGGLSTSIAEVAATLTLAADLQSDVDPYEAAKRCEQNLFRFSNAVAVESTVALLDPPPAHRESVRGAAVGVLESWRDGTGRSPRESLERWLRASPMDAAPRASAS